MPYHGHGELIRTLVSEKSTTGLADCSTVYVDDISFHVSFFLRAEGGWRKGLSIAEWLAGLQHVLNTLQGFWLPAKAEESFPFQVEEVLFRHLLRTREIPTA